MAEVRKKVVEDKYNTSSIKTETKKVENQKKEKKTTNKKEIVVEKKSLFARFMTFCHGVKSEFKKVHWTNKKDMVKYSIATIITIIFLVSKFFSITTNDSLSKAIVYFIGK